MLGDCRLGPFGDAGGGFGPAFDGGSAAVSVALHYILVGLSFSVPDGITLYMAQLLVIAVLAQIDARPAAKQRQRAVNGAQLPELRELGEGLLLRAAENWTEQGQELEAPGVAAKLRPGQLADLSDVGRDGRRAVARHEDGLGVLRGERLAGPGRPGLQDQRRALRTGLADVWPGDGEVFPDVVDLAHARGLRVDAARAVQHDGVVAPG